MGGWTTGAKMLGWWVVAGVMDRGRVEDKETIRGESMIVDFSIDSLFPHFQQELGKGFGFL